MIGRVLVALALYLAAGILFAFWWIRPFYFRGSYVRNPRGTWPVVIATWPACLAVIAFITWHKRYA